MMSTASIAQALFVSDLQPSERPSAAQVARAVADSLCRHGGRDGCAAACAAAYGEHPDSAAGRMRWALGLTRSGSADPRRAA
jgi:hypothetical protein